MAAVAALLMFPAAQIPQDNADSAGMLSHLHALVVQGDLLHDAGYAQLGVSPMFAFVTRGGAGVVSNHWPAGATFLQVPGFVLGRWGARWCHGEGLVGAAAPWVLAPLGVRALAALLTLIAGLGVARWVGERSDRPMGAALTAFGLVAGTPWLYYALEAPLRPHAWAAAATTLLVWLWSRADLAAHEPRTRALLLGGVSGICAAIRPQLAPLLLLAWHDQCPQLWRVRWRALAIGPAQLRGVALSTGTFLLCASAPLRIQRWIYGDGLGGYLDGGSAPLETFLIPFLSSPYHGVLLWCPVFVFGVAGLCLGALRGERGAWLLLALFAGQVWLDAGYREIAPFSVLGSRTWAGGTAFGPRKLLDAAPLLLPGAIWWLESPWLDRPWVRRLLGGGVVASIALTLWLAVASFLDPGVTQEVMDRGRYLAAMRIPLEGTAWSSASVQRAIPNAVRWRLAGAVVPPFLIAAGLGAWLWRRSGPLARMRGLAALTLGLGVTAQLWVSVAIVRSEARLEEDPRRMQRAAARMQAAHVDAVRRAGPAHRAMVRDRLGAVVPAP